MIINSNGDKYEVIEMLYIGLLLSKRPIRTGGQYLYAYEEPHDPDYKRIPLTNKDLELNSRLNLVNKKELVFPQASENWGDLRFFGIFKRKERGYLYNYAPLDNIRSIFKGDTVIFPKNELKIILFD